MRIIYLAIIIAIVGVGCRKTRSIPVSQPDTHPHCIPEELWPITSIYQEIYLVDSLGGVITMKVDRVVGVDHE